LEQSDKDEPACCKPGCSRSSCNQSARVIEDYQSAYPDPLRLGKGDRIKVEVRECEWPGWLWATGASGKAGWVPAAYLSVTGETGELLRDYDATELDARAGDSVLVMERESGWVFCRKTNGSEGWLPEGILAI
jgi:hypothetical protein